MTAPQLYLLGRRLVKLAEDALPTSESRDAPPVSVRMILFDVSDNPGSSISEIAARTGFPQSHVSAAVKRLRGDGLLEPRRDQHDRQRTLVRVAPRFRRAAAQRGSAPIDGVLADALATTDPAEIARVQAALELLGERLIPRSQRG